MTGDGKKSFWSTMPGIITAVAAIVTGLGTLIPIMLGITGSKPPASTHPASSQSPTPAQTTGAPSGSTAPDATSPSLSGDSASPGGSALLTANPPSLNLGAARAGTSSGEASVTISNSGPATATIDGVKITDSSTGQFAITSTSCGTGVTLAPQAACQVGVQFAPRNVGNDTASLVVGFHSPQASVKVALSGTGSLL